MSGFDAKRFEGLTESLANRLKCGICLGIFRDPTDTRCEHTFCSICIKEWIKTSNSCPECRQSLSTARVTRRSVNTEPQLKTNRLVKNIINDLKFRCFSETNGCQQLVEFGSLSAHLENCEQYLCEDLCGLQMGRPEEHNCQLLMQNEMLEFEKLLNQYKQRSSTSSTPESDQKSDKLEEVMERKRKQYSNRMKKWDSLLETRLESERLKSLQLFEGIESLIDKTRRAINEIRADPEFENKHDSKYKKRLIEVETETEEIFKQLKTDRQVFDDICQPIEKKMKTEDSDESEMKLEEQTNE